MTSNPPMLMSKAVPFGCLVTLTDGDRRSRPAKSFPPAFYTQFARPQPLIAGFDWSSRCALLQGVTRLSGRVMRYREGQSPSDKIQLEFLEAELELCNTLLNVAESEVDHKEAAAEALQKARRGYETVVPLIGTVKDIYVLNRLTSRLYFLKERIDSFPL